MLAAMLILRSGASKSPRRAVIELTLRSISGLKSSGSSAGSSLTPELLLRRLMAGFLCPPMLVLDRDAMRPGIFWPRVDREGSLESGRKFELRYERGGALSLPESLIVGECDAEGSGALLRLCWTLLLTRKATLASVHVS